MSKASKISATEANRSFSALLERVKGGDVVDITSHGKVVAEIRPKRDDEAERRRQSLRDHLAVLRKREFKVIGPWTRAELYERD